MQDLTTWDNVIKRGEAACHGATGKILRLDGIDAAINSVTVSKEPDGYSISLEACFKFGNGLSKEQVEQKLREFQALDNEWE